MCGIAGQCRRDRTVNPELLDSLSASLAHRGPDGSGTWITEDQKCGLGHRRLAILDLSSQGAQPMVSPDGRYAITFNGEIYNFRKLREELEDRSETFRSVSDTEVLLRLWCLFGLECLGKLRGMYAFAVWDGFERTLTLVRDPLGIKPLYYHSDGSSITFASEFRSLSRAGLARGVSPEGLGAFLQWGSIPAPLTFGREVHAVAPGCGLTWSQETGSISPFSHWSASDSFASRACRSVSSREEAVRVVREALLSSVRDHLVSDVPVGAFLSGGIDSSAVVSLMRQVGQKEIRTFCLAFEGEDLDESGYARLAAQTYGTDHHERLITDGELGERLQSFLGSLDQPTVDGFNTWLVSGFARENGSKVVTSGVGGDEAFAGYESTFRRLPSLARRMLRIPVGLRRLMRPGLSGLSKAGPANGRLLRLSELLAQRSLRASYQVFRMIFTPCEVMRLLRDKELAEAALRFQLTDILPEASEETSEEHQIRMWETRAYLESQLLMDSDKFSMRHGLELRTPLVDREFTETIASIPPPCFYGPRGTPKALLVEAVGDIPDELVSRRKRTFTLPVAQWLHQQKLCGQGGLLDALSQGEWRSQFAEREVERIEKGFLQGRVHWSRPWTLAILAYCMARLDES